MQVVRDNDHAHMVNLSPIYYESQQLKLMDIKHSVL